MTTESYNPYAAPAADLRQDGTADRGNAERIRREYLNHEASIRSVGLLYYLGFFSLVLGTAMLLFSVAFGDLPTDERLAVLGATLLMGLGCFLYWWLARGLRALDPRVRWGVGILSGLGLLGFPLGTLINGYILYLIFSQKGKFVFSDRYRRIVRETPQIKYRTPTWLKVLGLGILVLLLIAVVAGILAA